MFVLSLAACFPSPDSVVITWMGSLHPFITSYLLMRQERVDGYKAVKQMVEGIEMKIEGM